MSIHKCTLIVLHLLEVINKNSGLYLRICKESKEDVNKLYNELATNRKIELLYCYDNQWYCFLNVFRDKFIENECSIFLQRNKVFHKI